MTIREYMDAVGDRGYYTFIIAKAVKDSNSPFYHWEYTDTPMMPRSEWRTWWNRLDEFWVLHPHRQPIDFSGSWDGWYKAGHLECVVIVNDTEWEKMYKGEQGRDLARWYNIKVQEAVQKKLDTGEW